MPGAMTPCIESKRTPSQKYPHVFLGRKSIGEHRFVWMMANGGIPAGLLVCHHCDNTRCIRLEHLFLGTPKQNTLDAQAKGRLRVGAPNRGKTHCVAGHPFDEENTLTASRPEGKEMRICRICHRERKREWRRQRRAQGLKVT